MKLYRTQQGAVVERDGRLFEIEDRSWDALINDDGIMAEMIRMTDARQPASRPRESLLSDILPPIVRQEVWASGVTYLRSKEGRQEESKKTGGGDIYARVYEAERPELFFKATAYRTVGPGQQVRIRKDSSWNVPEPELTLVVTSSGRVVGYTIGNDMSSRSLEGENPLYLPQAKTYDGCCALGPCVLITDTPLPGSTVIRMSITRGVATIFAGDVTIDRMKRSQHELVEYLFREASFPFGCLLMTGTGIVPPSDMTLAHGDVIRIDIDQIGSLMNIVA